MQTHRHPHVHTHASLDTHSQSSGVAVRPLRECVSRAPGAHTSLRKIHAGVSHLDSIRLPAWLSCLLTAGKILKTQVRDIHGRTGQSLGERRSVCSVTWPFVWPLLFPRLCLIQKSIHCVCLLCAASNKPLFVPITKASRLHVANKFQGLGDMMTNCNAVYILGTIRRNEEPRQRGSPLR